jgi:RNA polymerase sigma-70 factor (ECF subfamily)
MPQLIDAARRGSREALGRLLDVCRNYLLLVASQELPAKVKAKIAPSDLVQNTFLDAQRLFERFHGKSEKELLAWLRRILLYNVEDAKVQLRHEDPLHGTPFQELLKGVADDAESPGAQAAATEDRRLLQQALNQLPEDYRQAVLLRNYERLSFEEIGHRLARGTDPACLRAPSRRA